MPFNLLKRYPELLDLIGLDEPSRNKSLRAIFDRDITNNISLVFRTKKIYPTKTDGKLDLDREFRHLTTVESEGDCSHRVYDPFRSERLHWIKPHLEETISDNSDISVFSVKERNQQKRVDVIRTYIYNKTKRYVIVLEPQIRSGNSYYLLTAYYLDKKYGEKILAKKIKNKLPEII
jgi:hypothetical protein